MAYARLRGKTWSVRWKDALGAWQETASTATTKREADRLCRELERKVERQRLGLEPLPADASMTFGELCTWWLDNRCPPATRYDETKRLGKHVLRTKLGELRLAHVDSAAIDARLYELERKEGASPASVNKVRSVLSTVIHRATQAKIWIGPNPVELVEPRRVPKRTYEVLSAEEVERLLPFVPRAWRGEHATAAFLALRKGEILGLRKADVDLESRLVRVRWSFNVDLTKARHDAILPIPQDLVPYFAWALEHAPGELVFPGRKGQMRTKEADPQKVLRRALARAGMVVGYELVCRRCKGAGRPGHTAWSSAKPAADSICSTCGMRLWARALPRPMRFHDLRHSTATILLRKGVPPQHVQRILRHAQVSTTVDLYGHMVVEDLRDALELVQPTEGGRRRRGAGVGQVMGVGKAEGPEPQKTPETSGPSEWALQVSNLRPQPCELGARGVQRSPPSASLRKHGT